ncbi:hypothetical protein DEU34_1357 [Microbacterium sp. AG1240]|uniref:DUF3800 domain-containing protein n=1 Tax=Microbacterium sp. AG1240 TaxID=2183992 RepID=UPI000EACB2EA|nr:DUF3800 domain-containing protein [Microbacterium sp. AG1240]RKT36829.1 hypothetical protein DEU34_1357 [Microbacterium sp. AG1240]
MIATTPLVVACDESGNDGENLLSGGSTVFAHASVTLLPDEAAALMEEVRARTRSQATELKSKTILQPQHLVTAKWLLSHPSIDGNASVHLTHKKYFVVSKLFDSTAEELAHELGYDIYETGVALAGANLLFFVAPRSYGTAWDMLLMTFQHFMRAKDADQAQQLLARLIGSTVKLLSDENAVARDVLGTVFAGFSHLGSLSRLQLGDGLEERLRTMDPLISAVGAAVHFWASISGKPIELIHDAAKELTPVKIEWAKRSLARPEDIAPSRQGLASELTDVRLVDSKEDPRVQVADLLAGIGRIVGESIVNEQQHPLGPSLLPMASGASLWPIPENMNVENARQAMLSQF